MEKIIDLHIHSVESDGTFTPYKIIDEAVNKGLKIISIADHDTLAAYNQELFSYAKSKNIKLISAVEISTKINKAGIHILGYNIDINNKELKAKLNILRNARHDYLIKVSKKLTELGYHINIAKLNKIDAVTKAHIADDIINSEENKELLFNTFGHIPNKGEFIETILNEGCVAYIKKETISPNEAATLIHNANGKVVLAHPVTYKYEDNLSEQEIINLIKEINADGIESNYIYIDCNNKKINEISKWNKVAQELNLIATIGSDFHTNDNIHPSIGLKSENIQIDNNIINNLITNLINLNNK